MNAADANRCHAVPDRVESALRRGAEAASAALSRWTGREARIAVSRVCLIDLSDAVEALGPGEGTVVSCGIPLDGPMGGTILLACDEGSAMALVDALLGRPADPAGTWGELERSAVQETANIVACALVGVLAGRIGRDGPLVPGPPEFRVDFAGSLLQSALVDQAARGDRIVLVDTRFALDGIDRPWSLLIVPSADGRAALGVDIPGGDS